MKKSKNLPERKKDLLNLLLKEQEKGIYFADYVNNLLLDKKYKIEGDLLTSVLEYCTKVLNGKDPAGYNYDSYIEFNLFDYIKSQEIILTKEQLDLAFDITELQGYAIPYKFFHENPNWVDRVIENSELDIIPPERKNFKLIPKNLEEYINQKFDYWVKMGWDLTNLYLLGKLPDNFICKLAAVAANSTTPSYYIGAFQQVSYYRQNFVGKLPKKAFLILVPSIVDSNLRIDEKAIPSGLKTLYKFFIGKASANDVKISKERLLRDYPTLLTAANTKIRNWATAIASGIQSINVGNKEYKLTAVAKEKLLKILSTYSNSDLEEKLKAVLQG